MTDELTRSFVVAFAPLLVMWVGYKLAVWAWAQRSRF